jgi:hypothetical protein
MGDIGAILLGWQDRFLKLSPSGVHNRPHRSQICLDPARRRAASTFVSFRKVNGPEGSRWPRQSALEPDRTDFL